MADALLAPPVPDEVQLEVTGACNLACQMCLVSYRPKLGRAQGAMSPDVFRQVLDALPELRRLTLQGLGEPLLSPHIVDMVREAASRGVDVGFNSNALLLTEALADRLMDAGLGWLHVSVDGGTPETYESIRHGARFEVLERNVRGLVARTRRHESPPRLSLVMVAMRRNIHELSAVVRLAAEWGVDRLRVQNLSHDFSDTDPAGGYAGIRAFAHEEALFTAADLRDVRRAFAEATGLAQSLGVELRLPRLDEPAELGRAAGTPACGWPCDSAYVTHRGDVQPCCMVMGSDRATMGNVHDATFAEVWRGPSYREFRQALLGTEPPDVCRGCSLYRRVF